MSKENVENIIIENSSNKDMIKNYIIALLNENNTIEEISKKLKMHEYEVINYLIPENRKLEKEIEDKIIKYYKQFQINNRKCLIISDTHIGQIINNDKNFTMQEKSYEILANYASKKQYQENNTRR